jgi:hypothetical protein
MCNELARVAQVHIRKMRSAGVRASRCQAARKMHHKKCEILQKEHARSQAGASCRLRHTTPCQSSRTRARQSRATPSRHSVHQSAISHPERAHDATERARGRAAPPKKAPLQSAGNGSAAAVLTRTPLPLTKRFHHRTPLPTPRRPSRPPPRARERRAYLTRPRGAGPPRRCRACARSSSVSDGLTLSRPCSPWPTASHWRTPQCAGSPAPADGWVRCHPTAAVHCARTAGLSCSVRKFSSMCFEARSDLRFMYRCINLGPDAQCA